MIHVFERPVLSRRDAVLLHGELVEESRRVEIELEDGEPIEKALRRFRKASNMCGHLRLLRNRKTFENNHDKAIRKKKESAMRQARARRSARSRAAAGF